MLDDPRLLVVDDEEVICEGCRRIFSRQGFEVEKCSDACQGLSLAQHNDYSAILLDIKMPTMDGIAFLEALRKQKADVPVVLMTGYPSIPNAASAIRLGASDYVTKPFTPEEITQAVHRLLHHDTTPSGRAGSAHAEPSTSAEPFRFWRNAWFQLGDQRATRVGAVLTDPTTAKIETIHLPRIGEVVYQGLPLAAVIVAEKPQQFIPAPLSGVVVAVNEALKQDPALLLSDPCGKGWIACISATRADDEAANCLSRRVVLYNPDGTTAPAQAGKLRSLGCDVHSAADWAQLSTALNEVDTPVVILDGSAIGDEGPVTVGLINGACPGAKVIVVASADANREAAYRLRRIFYYAVEPFADNEVAEILDAAFHRQSPGARGDRHREIAQPLSSIAITNRNGTRVRFQIAPGLLRREEGLGRLIHQKLVARLFPMESSPEEIAITPMNLVSIAEKCDRVIVLTTGDQGRLPGSLLRDTKGEFVSLSGKGGDKVVALVVQPAAAEGGILNFDPETNDALATHLVREMASC
ncbi:MAG: response regulator [Thermoguttaceae bacterium]